MMKGQKHLKKKRIIEQQYQNFTNLKRGEDGSNSTSTLTDTMISRSPYISSVQPQILPKPSPPLPLDQINNNNNNNTSSSSSSTTNWWNRFITRNSLHDNYDRAIRAEQYFQAITVQATNPQWFARNTSSSTTTTTATMDDNDIMRVVDDFRRQHALYTLHVWLIHKRLLHDPIDKEGGLLLQEDMFNIFWEDTISRIREKGVYELSVYENLSKVQQYTWIHLTNYDYIYTEFLQQPKQRFRELYFLLQRHFLLQFEDVVDDENNDNDSNNNNNEQDKPKRGTAENILTKNLQNKATASFLDRMAWYIEANYQNIVMEWPDEAYRQGRVAWIQLPFPTTTQQQQPNISATTTTSSNCRILPQPWLRNLTTSGKIYYWNPMTMESTWERPIK